MVELWFAVVMALAALCAIGLGAYLLYSGATSPYSTIWNAMPFAAIELLCAGMFVVIGLRALGLM